jgi:hypothetical protein
MEPDKDLSFPLSRKAADLFNYSCYVTEPAWRRFLARCHLAGRVLNVRVASGWRHPRAAIVHTGGVALEPTFYYALFGDELEIAASIEAGRPQASTRARPSGLAARAETLSQ